MKPHQEKTSLPLKLDFKTICIDSVGVFDDISCLMYIGVGNAYFAG